MELREHGAERADVTERFRQAQDAGPDQPVTAVTMPMVTGR